MWLLNGFSIKVTFGIDSSGAVAAYDVRGAPHSEQKWDVVSFGQRQFRQSCLSGPSSMDAVLGSVPALMIGNLAGSSCQARAYLRYEAAATKRGLTEAS